MPGFRPHIVFFNRSFYPDNAATGQLLTELCETLVETHGYEVTVIAGPSPSAPDRGFKWRVLDREKHRGIEIVRANGTTRSKHRFVGRFANYVTYFLTACWAGLRVKRPDVVVALTDPPIIGLAAFLSSRRFGAPFVMAYQDVFPEVAKLLEDFQSNSVNKLLQRVNVFLATRADRVVALGETMRRRLIEGKGADPGTTVIIPNWADCKAITPGPRNNSFSAQHGLDGKFVVLHSGNMGLSQGLETTMEAAVYLRDYADIEMVFAGEGVKRAALVEKADRLGLENVRFLPYQPKELLPLSFASSDVFLISLKRGLAGYIVPSKLYGILAAGRPYVAAVEPETEVALVANRAECGLVASSDDPKSIAESILTLYKDPETRRRMGDNARRAALAFDRESSVTAYHELFTELACPYVPPRTVAFIKRSFDMCLSGTGLILSSPLWLLFAVLVKLNDGGPVFYGQSRVGKYGKPFKSWKFRSMKPDSDKKFGAMQAGENDPRVTPIGRALRATAMDELPQLWNIFCGDMSFVGPRALLPNEIEVHSGTAKGNERTLNYFRRYQVRPGLTGIAQIFAPRDIPRRQKFRLDALYVRRQRLLLDFKLIAVSFWITFRGKWEHRGTKF